MLARKNYNKGKETNPIQSEYKDHIFRTIRNLQPGILTISNQTKPKPITL